MAIDVTSFLQLTFAQAEHAYYDGRMTRTQWDAYRAIWQYSAPRFSEIAADPCGPIFPRVREYWAGVRTEDTEPEDGRAPHVCRFGPFAESRFAGTWRRECLVPGCRIVSLDGDEVE